MYSTSLPYAFAFVGEVQRIVHEPHEGCRRLPAASHHAWGGQIPLPRRVLIFASIEGVRHLVHETHATLADE